MGRRVHSAALAKRKTFRGFGEAFAWLASRTNYETMATQRYDARTYGLHRAERLLRDAGRPDRAFDTVQVLGSKGKGSTATALAAILRASGRRVGLFTSPHLIDPRERIRIDGAAAPDGLVCDALSALVPAAEAAIARREPLTFFELHTAAALSAFREAGCDAVVLEAGMGGRLDATSAARAVCKVITSISLDHTQHLGRTRAAIAFEKASAVRRGVPLVCGVRPQTAAGRVIGKVASDAGAPVLALGRDFDVRRVRTSFDAATGAARTTFHLRTRGASPVADAELAVPLLGTYQAVNAALAAVAAATARWRGGRISPDHVREGLAATSLRARLEAVSTTPLLLVDGAHNPQSVGLLARTVRDHVPGTPRVFVVGMAADKDVRGCLRRLRGVANHVVSTTSGQARAASPEDLARTARAAGLSAEPAPSLPEAIAQARRLAGSEGVIVVTGSLYLCGEFLRFWR